MNQASGQVEMDELSSAGSSRGPGLGQVEMIDELDSEEEIPLTQSYAQSQQASATQPKFNSSQPEPSGSSVPSRKRGRQTGSQYPYDGSIPDATEFMTVDQPRYTLTVASGTKSDPHVIKLGPGVTDGITSRHPEVGAPHINEGVLHAAPPHLLETWCLSIGGRVARLLGLPRSGKGEDSFRLESLPERYALFQNIKTIPPPRKDPYLWGPPRTNKSVRYRSAPELAPHVYWLLVHGEGDQRKECACRYCTGRSSQIAINRELGLQDSQVYHGAPRHYVHRSKPNAPRKPKRANSPPVNYLGPFTSTLRDLDLTPGAAPFRQSELVWVELDKALEYPGDVAEHRITHWPGLVCERHVKVCTNSAGGSQVAGAREADALKPVEQRNVYKVQLIALEDTPIVEEWSLAPWLGLSAAALSIGDFHNHASSSLVFDGESVLVPRLKNFGGDSQLGMVAYALAIQIAANIDVKFAAVDPYVSTNAALGVKIEEGVKGEEVIEYQSLWWGAEQIHSEELVRVLVTSDEVETISNAFMSNQMDQHGLFLKLSSIFQQPAQEGVEPVLKMAGTLLGLEEAQEEEDKTVVKMGDGAAGANDTAVLNLPPPPSGFRWRRLTPEGQHVVYEIELLAGRWYPLPETLEGHPDRIAQVMEEYKALQLRASAAVELNEPADVNYPQDQLALIMAGVLPAKLKHAQSSYWTEDRFRMICVSEAVSNEEMEAYLLPEPTAAEDDGAGRSAVNSDDEVEMEEEF